MKKVHKITISRPLMPYLWQYSHYTKGHTDPTISTWKLILGAVGSLWTMWSTNRFRLDRFLISDMASYYWVEYALISNTELCNSNE